MNGPQETFEFWLEQGVKVKHCWALSTNFLFSVQYKADSKQNMVFSVALLISWMGAKIQISLHYRILTRFLQGLFKSFGLYLKWSSADKTSVTSSFSLFCQLKKLKTWNFLFGHLPFTSTFFLAYLPLNSATKY